MHACRSGVHLSGAERIAPANDLERLTAALVGRALGHGRGRADEIRLTVEALDPATISRGRLPDLTTMPVEDFAEGRRAATALLAETGVAPDVARRAIELIAAGAAPDGASMRGAMLMDAGSGARLEPDRRRGVRASRMDITPQAESRLREMLALRGLDNLHVREALVLAAKVLSTPGVVAELCWSDDPEYTAGYVAAPAFGYVRFPHLKPAGEERGGRVFFVVPDLKDIEPIIGYLEKAVLLIDDIGIVHGDRIREEPR